jgi:HD-GYP domain-containing protein (c-di-GMP phosphodiesterase class II)
MYLLAEATPGQVLALPALNAEGQVLVNAGVKLTPRILSELEKRAFHFVYIEDEETAGIAIEDAVTESKRHLTLNQMASSINGLASVSERFEKDEPRSISRALESQEVQDEIAAAGELNALVGTSIGIVGDIMEADTTAGLNTIRTHHARGHTLALDSAIAAVVLGKRLTLPLERLQALATGTILHDIGLSVLNPEFIELEEMDLDPEDFDRYRAHTLLGYKILRNRFGSDTQPAQIAYQHHERQDGTGYPRGLSGTNMLKRSVQRQGGGDQIHVLAEVAAVGIAYAELTNGSRRHAPLPPEQVRVELVDRAGTSLNSEIVGAFLKSFPMFPAGTEIIIENGRFAGCSGVVEQVSSLAMDRPTLRILRDPKGKKIPAITHDLRQHVGTQIRGYKLEKLPVELS